MNRIQRKADGIGSWFLITLLFIVLFAGIAFGQDPVPRPQPLSYSPNPNATTISIKWYYYAVYQESLVASLTKELEALKASGGTVDVTIASRLSAIEAEQKAINANTAALAAGYHQIIKPLADTAAANTKLIFEKTTSIDANTLALSQKSYALKTGQDTLLGNMQTLLGQQSNVTVDLTPLQMSLTGLKGDTTAILAALAAKPPSNITITIPSPDDVKAGSSLTLIASADGSPTPTWQWKKDGNVMSGATSAVLSFPAVTANDTGIYTAIATNEAGSASASVRVNVVQ